MISRASIAGASLQNLLMDPFESRCGDLNRQYAEHKAWVLTPFVSASPSSIWQRSGNFQHGRSV